MSVKGADSVTPADPWVGAIPEPWILVPLKHAVTYNDEVLPESTPADLVLDYVEISDVTHADGIRQTTNVAFGEAPSRARRIARPGDVLVSTVRTYLRAIAPVIGAPITVSTGFAVLRAGERVRPDYLKYVCLSGSFVERIISRSTGVSYPAINASELVETPIPVPPLVDQDVIVGFLDRETAKIDALIAKQEQLIATLREDRSATITQAVSQGLNMDVNLAQSPTEWLGPMPEHWSHTKLKWKVSLVTSGSRGWAQFYADEGKYFIRIGNLTRGSLGFDDTDVQCVDPPVGAEGSRTVTRDGDLLFSITAYLGSIAVVDAAHRNAYVSQHVSLARISDREVDPYFLGYVVLSETGQRQLKEQAYGGTKIQLSLEDVRGLEFPLPPVGEQREIVRFLDIRTAKIDALIAKSSQMIDTLREYRSALITDVVTGKIDVREVA